ncbi:MAG: adenosylcobinamide-phosphate synthase CbiB [Nitrospinota bacterium]|nr:adenosylcobinamide-phosphate synthase CbiB [Nitrospinota bacterium]MDH5756768.1 adenosylcobinamide-phosphate synthase CbiB [Nitrospinota bacterium]
MTFLLIGGAALALDALLGDPRWFPHPVRLIGAFCVWAEPKARRWLGDTKLAGMATVGATLSVTGFACWALVVGMETIHPALGMMTQIALAYFAISMRDLKDHAMAAYDALDRADLAGARGAAGMMVGRDTTDLPEEGIVRAVVESVAENSVDGIIAPLFFIALGGGVGAMLFKAVSTMDSMFGYKNQRYVNFGWAAARLDDVANYIPARLAGGLIPLVAWARGLDGAGAWRIMWRDGGAHASPNAGIAESAFAGALGVRLGGVNRYDGVEKQSPYMGERTRPLWRGAIREAAGLMVWLTVGCYLVLAALLLYL